MCFYSKSTGDRRASHTVTPYEPFAPPWCRTGYVHGKLDHPGSLPSRERPSASLWSQQWDRVQNLQCRFSPRSKHTSLHRCSLLNVLRRPHYLVPVTLSCQCTGAELSVAASRRCSPASHRWHEAMAWQHAWQSSCSVFVQWHLLPLQFLISSAVVMIEEF